MWLTDLNAALFQCAVNAAEFAARNGAHLAAIVGVTNPMRKSDEETCFAAAARVLNEVRLHQLGRIEIMKPAPNSLIVLRLNRTITPRDSHIAAQALMSVVPPGCKSVVFGPEMDIAFLDDEALRELGLWRMQSAGSGH